MDKILIRGGKSLDGTIEISGAKNAALPIMAAGLLTDRAARSSPTCPTSPTSPRCSGCCRRWAPRSTQPPARPAALVLHAPRDHQHTAAYDLVRKMRASVLVLGPLLARTGEAKVSLPGGCAIGPRPIDLHLMGLERLGARIELRERLRPRHARRTGLNGAEIRLRAALGRCDREPADGGVRWPRARRVIAGAAREPEIVDLARCLIAMGAQDRGRGHQQHHASRACRACTAPSHAIMPDRIEAGTYAMAAGDHRRRASSSRAAGSSCFGARRGGASRRGVRAGGRSRAGVAGSGRQRRARGQRRHDPARSRASPTDLQAQFMALMCVAEGAAMITETIFENRFMHVPELARMGARITVHGGSALVRGVRRLKGAPVMATDLRASVSLVLAALAAEGETEINRVYHLDRGYERLEEKLVACGAQIERVR